MSSPRPEASAPAHARGPRLLGVPVPARAFGLAPGWCRDDAPVVAPATKQDPRPIAAAPRPLRIVGGMSHRANDTQVAAA